MIPTATIAKKIARSFIFITLFRITASGKDRPAMDIMKAREVPNGTPFAVIEKINGTSVEQPA